VSVGENGMLACTSPDSALLDVCWQDSYVTGSRKADIREDLLCIDVRGYTRNL
jgi:hypothetical protein